jgi:prepilin-type N-terminal cleavage/methylation domain-containing protein
MVRRWQLLTARKQQRNRVAEPRRSGLSLMELVVVLAILAGLAAIVVPMFPDLLRRTHKATDATQTSEMAKIIQLYQALYFSYPDGFDQLTDGQNFPNYLPQAQGFSAPFGGMVQLGQLTANEVAALNSVGIVRAAPLAPSGTTDPNFQVTMWPYADGNAIPAPPVAIDTAQQYALLNRAGVQANNPRFLATVLASDPTARFIVFGVGPKCSMVGNTIQTAPTSVPQNNTLTPGVAYCRVGVIFQVSGVAVANGDNRALFVCSCALEDDELESTEKDIVGYYQVSQKPQ